MSNNYKKVKNKVNIYYLATFGGLKVLSAFLHLLLHSNARQTIFYMKANTFNPDQTAPKGSV